MVREPFAGCVSQLIETWCGWGGPGRRPRAGATLPYGPAWSGSAVAAVVGWVLDRLVRRRPGGVHGPRRPRRVRAVWEARSAHDLGGPPHVRRPQAPGRSRPWPCCSRWSPRPSTSRGHAAVDRPQRRDRGVRRRVRRVPGRPAVAGHGPARRRRRTRRAGRGRGRGRAPDQRGAARHDVHAGPGRRGRATRSSPTAGLRKARSAARSARERAGTLRVKNRVDSP